MNPTWLTDFLSLNESRSFSRAAEQRHLTQPAFGRWIQVLEQWAGVPLFERNVRSVLDRERFKSVSVGADALLAVATPVINFGVLGQNAVIGSCISYSDDPGLGRFLSHVLENAVDVSITRPSFTSHHAGVLKMMACGEQGLTWLPRSIILGELARRDFVQVGRAD